MYELKLQSKLVFYDYVVDQNDQLATLFLNDPFIDSAIIEKEDKARKYWKFFTTKQLNKDVSILAEKKLNAKNGDASSSSSYSSSDTDSDSDLDKDTTKNGPVT